MYERFFQFTCLPFAVLPDADCILWTSGHRSALSTIEAGLLRFSQLILLTGGAGTGKTTLIRHLLQTLPGEYSARLLPEFGGERGDLLPRVMTAFGMDGSDASPAIMHRRLKNHFADELGRGRRPLLIVDDAHDFSAQNFESLRLLSDLNTDKVMVTLVLVGQRQLRAKMARSENQALYERIGADYHLEPLTRAETSRYIRHRCMRAGGSPNTFDVSACDAVYTASAGIPREINVLCNLSLISAYGSGVHTVDHRIVRSVVEDARSSRSNTKLMEHDISSVFEGRMVAEGGTDHMAAEADGSSRDPLQRLARVIQAGRQSGSAGRVVEPPPVGARPGGPAAMGPEIVGVTAVSPAAVGPTAVSPAAIAPRAVSASTSEESAPSTREQTEELNALFNFAWSDDVLLFVDHAADGNAPRRAEKPTSVPARSDSSPSRPTTVGAKVSAAVDQPPAHRRSTTANAGSRGRALFVTPRQPRNARDRSEERPTAVRTVPTAEIGEVALRRAFAPRTGWHRMGWRGAASLVALAASGSMAAGIAIALLPDGSLPLDPANETKGPRIEAGGTEIARDMPHQFVTSPDAAAAPARPPARAGTAEEKGSSRRSSASVDPVSPPDVAASQAVRTGDAVAMRRPGSMADDVLPGGTNAGPESVRLPQAPLGDASAIATAGMPQPTPEMVVTAHPIRGLTDGAPRLERLGLADAAPGLDNVQAVPGVDTSKEAPARPSAGALQSAGAREPAEVTTGLTASPTRGAELASAAAQRGAPHPSSSGRAEPEAVFRHAVDIALEDPRAAAIAYARAALLGHDRAAYYLGQIYETGDGVPVDFAIARYWYEASSAENPRALDRLAELPQPQQAGELAPPVPLLADPSATGQADFVWSSGEGADPTSYVVELSSDPGEGAVAAYPVTGSAARLPLVPEASHWRVLALEGTGSRTAASEWQELSSAETQGSAAVDQAKNQL